MRERPVTATNLPPPAGRNRMQIFWSELTTPLDRLLIAVSSHGLCAIKFDRLEPELKSRYISRSPIDGSKTLLHQVSAELQDYFSSRRKAFDMPLDLSSLTPFQRDVLTVTSRISWGEVWSYRRVAEEMGRPKASRAVGQALGRNPIPIVIPCHRVIASDGSLGGYCGTTGLDLKRWLLRHEGARL